MNKKVTTYMKLICIILIFCFIETNIYVKSSSAETDSTDIAELNMPEVEFNEASNEWHFYISLKDCNEEASVYLVFYDRQSSLLQIRFKEFLTDDITSFSCSKVTGAYYYKIFIFSSDLEPISRVYMDYLTAEGGGTDCPTDNTDFEETVNKADYSYAKLGNFIETKEVPASANKWDPAATVRADTSGTGVVTASESGTYAVSDYIPVGDNTELYLYYSDSNGLHNCDGSVMVRVYFFDEEKRYVNYDWATTSSSSNKIEIPLSKANRAYVRLRVAYSFWANRIFMMSFTPQTKYVEYKGAETIDVIKAVLEINGEKPDSDGRINIPIVGDVKVNGASVVSGGTANIAVPDAYTKTQIDERIYDGALSAFYTTPSKVTITSDGLAQGNVNYKFKVFAVLGGARYKVQTSGYWQFQEVSALAASAPSGRIGETYHGSGEAAAPENANFLLVGCSNSEEPKVYCTSMSELKRAAFSNVLFGKKYIAAGDSYTQISDATFAKGKYAGETVTYDRVIRERNFMSGANRGISGSTMAVPQGDKATEYRVTNAFSNTRYKNIPSDTDILTIAFGINDNSLCDLGQLGDTTNATFYGAWDVVLKYYAENMPKMKIGIIIFARSDNNGFYTAVKNIAKYYGIPYLDFYGGEDTPIYVDGKVYPVNAGIDSMKKAYFGIPAHAASEAESFQGIDVNTKIGSASMGHPNYKAHIDEATIIEEFLRSL